jgi:hypothetical protein
MPQCGIWPFEPVEELGGGVDLIVVLAVREDGHLMEVFGEPGCRFRDVDKAVLDHRGLGVQPDDLLAFQLVVGDTMAAICDQFLDQLSARGLFLDQQLGGAVQVLLFAQRALERRVFQPLTQHAQQVELLAVHTPGRTDAEVAELGRLVGGVPALHDTLEALRPLVLA